MPLNEIVIPIDFGQGIDTKTDPKLVVPGKMLRLENAVFTNVKRIAKRNGYTILGSPTNIPRLVHEYNNELLMADGVNLNSYSKSQDAFIDIDQFVSTEVARTSIDQETPGGGFVDSAVFGNYAIYAWNTVSSVSVPSSTHAIVVDLQTGTTLANMVPSVQSTIVLTPVKCVLLGGTTLAVIYLSSANTIKCRIVIFSGGGVVTFSAEVTVASDAAPTSFGFGIDVVQTVSGASVLYRSSTAGSEVKVVNINTTGTPTATRAISDANATGPYSISVNNTNLWIYWTNATVGPPVTANTLYYAIFNSTLSTTVLTRTAIIVLGAPFYITNLITVNSSLAQQQIYFGQYIQTSASGPEYTDKTTELVTNQDGTVTNPNVAWNGTMPWSKSFQVTVNGVTNTYAVFVYRGTGLNPSPGGSDPIEQGLQIQPTFFTLKLNNIPTTLIPLCVARFGSGVANTQGILLTIPSYSPAVNLVSSSKVILGLGIVTQEFLDDYFERTTLYAPGGLAGSYVYSIDFDSRNAYRALNAGGITVLNGGLIQNYDGQTCNEFGFHLFPEIANAGASLTAGQMHDGTYSYIAIFQWTDNQGNLHQSAPSEAVEVVLAGGTTTQSVDLRVSLNYLTQKIGSSLAIYRTSGQTAGTVYFLVTDPIFLTDAYPFPLASVTFNDKLSDVEIQGNPQAYTYPASSILENSTPPPSMIMVAHNNRLWFVDSENPNTIWYTKSFSPGTGLSPSALMLEQIDPKFGNITALNEMDDKIVIFKQNGIFVQSGDGVNDTGTNQTLSFPQIVPSDVGCSVLKSTITFPNGVMFQSPNGVYLVDRSLSVSYIGMPVQQYNSQIVSSANLVQGKSQIRFLVENGLTLVFDYIFNQWSTFTNHTGRSATVWQGNYVYATEGGDVFQEASGSYTDDGNAYSLLAQTSWLALASVQGFQRVRRLIMLGDFTNGASNAHKIQISAAYDFNTSLSVPVPYTLGVAVASKAFQYRERLPRQKCDAISLLIQEVTTGDNAEYIDLSNISFEAGAKKGVNKLQSSQSVG